MSNGAEYPPIVYQAQGMVSVQAGCELERALQLMKDTADATSETLEFVAAEVIARRVSFFPPS